MDNPTISIHQQHIWAFHNRFNNRFDNRYDNRLDSR